jgi:DNA-binding NtrC family response regulator
LRKRREDIPVLLRFITEKICRKLGIKNIPEIDSSIMGKLMDYSWPGNIREMENSVEREIILNRNTGLKFDCIINNLKDKQKQDAPADSDNTVLDSVMKSHILKTLKQTNWRISGKNGAAYILGIHPNTLRHRMKKLGIF